MNNLYKVELRGMKHAVNAPTFGVSYVVAEDTAKAYETVRAYLDEHQFGFKADRELLSVTLIAGPPNGTIPGPVLFA